MIETPTVLILGAGASYPYGYPLGNELIEIIKTILEPNSERVDDLIDLGYSKEQISEFKQQLSESRLDTIDKFLEGHEEYREIGKIVIAQALILKESMDVYDCDQNFDWYKYLCNSLHAPSSDEFYLNELSIITFNYDRSLEQYLFKALEHFYSETSAVDLIKNIDIVHVYGKLDHLPEEDWQKGKKRAYGTFPSEQSLLESSNGIKLIHESKKEGSLNETGKLLRNAKKLYFLGFGYDKTNLNNLNIIDNFLEKKEGKRTISQGASGTGYRLPMSIRNNITTFNHRIKIENERYDCLKFLESHGL